MVRVALLAGFIALALVVQVFASGGVQVAVNEIINSTDSASLTGLNYDHFLGPDSKVDQALQTAILKFKELETAPSCNKLASAALIHTCATLGGDNESQESMEDTLTEEKILFAARLAVCELSDSADRSLVPAECASFILTKSNTKQRGWFAYYSAKGREQSIPRYPEYDQATRQHRDTCVGALQKSPVTGFSYSNAKQTAHQWCSIARVDIEKEKLYQAHKTFMDSMVHQDDILRSHAETLVQHKQANDFLGNQLRTFAQDHMDMSEALREVMTDARRSVHDLVEDLGVKLQAKLEDSMEAHDAHDASIKAKADNIFSHIMNATAQQSKDLQLARRNDAEEFSRRLSFAGELVEQQIIQFSSDLDSASREVAVERLETLEVLQLVKYQMLGAGEFISNLTSGLQELQDEATELRESVKDARTDMADLASEVRAVKSYISAFKSFFTGSYNFILAAASYYLYLIGAGAFLLFLCLGGWPILAPVTTSMIKLLMLTFNKLKELAQLVLFHTGKFLSSTMSAAQQWVDSRGAVLLILSVAGTAFYFVAIETPTAYLQRWENGELSLFEPAHCVVMVVILVVLLCAISKPALAIRESGFLQSGEPERYDDKESVV